MRTLLGLLALVLVAVGIAAIASKAHPGGDLPPSEQPDTTQQPAATKPTAKPPNAADAAAFDKYKAGAIHATLEINGRGTIGMELYPKAAPKTVAHFLSLVKNNFYRGIKFHRVESWVIQAGDPVTRGAPVDSFDSKGAGSHGSGTQTVPLEAVLPHIRGAVGLARSQDPNSGDSQFYILLDDKPELNGQYCIFGRVVSGENVPATVQKGDEIEKLTSP